MLTKIIVGTLSFKDFITPPYCKSTEDNNVEFINCQAKLPKNNPAQAPIITSCNIPILLLKLFRNTEYPPSTKKEIKNPIRGNNVNVSNPNSSILIFPDKLNKKKPSSNEMVYI